MSMVNCVSTICHYLPTSVLHSNLIPKIFFYISNVLDYNLFDDFNPWFYLPNCEFD
jgi:hypothetical protein